MANCIIVVFHVYRRHGDSHSYFQFCQQHRIVCVKIKIQLIFEGSVHVE